MGLNALFQIPLCVLVYPIICLGPSVAAFAGPDAVVVEASMGRVFKEVVETLAFGSHCSEVQRIGHGKIKESKYQHGCRL